MRPTPAMRRTIVLVLDGLRPDAIDAFELPHLQRRERLANRAAARARTFNWGRIFDDLLADYRRVIAASRESRAQARRQ